MDSFSNSSDNRNKNEKAQNKPSSSQNSQYNTLLNNKDNHQLKNNIKKTDKDVSDILNEGLPHLSEDDSMTIENLQEIKNKMRQAISECNTSEYETFQSLASLFQENPIYDNTIGSSTNKDAQNFDENYFQTQRKEFGRYFQISDYYLDINLFGHKQRVEQDNDGRVAKQYRFRYAEYLYSVGSKYVKMFRSLEENTGKIHSIKIATLLFSKPETYFSFQSCIKEAMQLNQLDKIGSSLLGLEGYFFRRKRGMKFWDTEIQLVMILDDHDMTLQDLMRARRSSNNPWNQDQIISIINNIHEMIEVVEKKAGVKLVSTNPLNILYSKRKDSLLLGNLQNILSGREQKLVGTDKFSTSELSKIENFFNRVFPDVKDLYENKDSINIKEAGSNFSISIIALQMAEILFNSEIKAESKEEFINNLSKNSDKNSSKVSQKLNELLHLLSLKYKGESVKPGYFSLITGRQSFNENLVASLRTSMAKNVRPFSSQSLNKNSQSGNKISEVNTSNNWKKLQRNLDPSKDWKKKLYESEFFESFGRNRSSLESCRHVIQVYNKVENLDKKSWSMILEKLVEYFLLNDLKEDASNHAKTIMGLVDSGVSQESLIYQISIACVVDPAFAFQKYQQFKDKMTSSMQKSSLSFILSQFFRRGEEPLKNELVNNFVMQDASLFNRRTLEFLAKGFSSLSIQQITTNFDGMLAKCSGDIKRLILKNNSAVTHFASGEITYANKMMAEIEPAALKVFESDKYKKMDVVDINNNVSVFAQGQSEYAKGIKVLKANLELSKELVCTSHKSLLVITNNLSIAYYQKGDFKNANQSMKLLFSNFREKWQIGKHTNPAYVLNYIMILTKNENYTEAKSLHKKLREYIEENDVAFDFKIKALRHSVIFYTKIGKHKKALALLEQYFEATRGYLNILQLTMNTKSSNVDVKDNKENNVGTINEIRSQMLFMRRVKAIVLFKSGNKAAVIKAQKED